MLERIKTTLAPEPRGAYSQAVRIGNLLFVSGQLPTDRNGNLTKGTVATETVLALENVRALVEAADGTIEDIVQCTIYLSDMVFLAEVNQSYGDFFGGAAVLPARTVVPVKEMQDGARVQIQAIACLKSW